MNETVYRIPKHYVREDFGCAQVMIPYTHTLSMFDKNGLIFNHDKENDFVNMYLEQSLRNGFPYHNIPNHITRKGLFGEKINVTNQLLDFNEHYISVTDGVAIDRCVFLDKDQALLMSKVLPANIDNNREYSNEYVTMTRKELDNMFKSSNEKEKVYISTTNGELYHSDDMGYMEEEHFLKIQKEKYQRQLNCCGNLSDDTREFIQRKINEMNLDDLRDYELPPSFYLIKIDGTDIKIQLIYCILVRTNEYRVTIKNIPLNKYVLEQFKFMVPNIVEIKEPKISLRLNPGVTEGDIYSAKEMVKRMQKRN